MLWGVAEFANEATSFVAGRKRQADAIFALFRAV